MHVLYLQRLLLSCGLVPHSTMQLLLGPGSFDFFYPCFARASSEVFAKEASHNELCTRARYLECGVKV